MKKASTCCFPKEFPRSENSDEDFKRLDQLLSDPARAEIIETILKNGPCVSKPIEELLSLDPSAANHIELLNNAGVIQGRIRGETICYCINQDTLKYFLSLPR